MLENYKQNWFKILTNQCSQFKKPNLLNIQHFEDYPASVSKQAEAVVNTVKTNLAANMLSQVKADVVKADDDR